MSFDIDQVGRIEYSPTYRLKASPDLMLQTAFNGNRVALEELQEVVRELREELALLTEEFRVYRAEHR